MKKITLLLSIPLLLALGCTKDKKLNVFTVSKDKELGEQLDAEIIANPKEYPILDRATHPEAYAYLEGIFNDVISSDKMFHKDDFDWKITILDTNVMNAFAAPGGKLYFYTGLMKYCKSSAELAGVMAHEIAHSDRRHTTNVLTKTYGVQILLNIVLGNDAGTLKQLASQMASGASSLAFSREHEYEADSMSVEFLYSIRERKNYQCTGIVDFFDRLVADGYTTGTGNFEFLQTHPYENNRKTNIEKVWTNLGKPAGEKFESDYATFVTKLQ